MSRTLAQALAAIESDLRPRIDSAALTIQTAQEAMQLAERAVGEVNAVRRARADLEAAQRALLDAEAAARQRSPYLRALADLQDAQQKLADLELRYAERVAKVRDYFEARAQADALAARIIDVPPEAV